MTGTKSLRKSNRLTKSGEGTNAQSRITEFVNVRKRASGIESAKKIEEIEVSERRMNEKRDSSVVLTPVKNKRKMAKGVAAATSVVEEIKRSGVLTPSASLESVNETAVDDGGKLRIEKENEAVVTAERKLPAYKRFAHLVEGVRNQKPKLDIEAETESVAVAGVVEPVETFSSSLSGHKFVPWLPLNDKWSMYEKIIFNVDNLCVLAAGRSQPCVFHKIQKTLENVLGRKVPLEQMEKLKTLWPEAYEYRESKIVMQGKRIDSVAFGVPGIGGTDSSAALLNERKEQVRGRVQKYLINAHRSLFSDNPEVNNIPKEWHGKFDQNEVAELPRTPLIESDIVVLPERSSTPKMINDIMSSTVTSTASIPKITSTSLKAVPQISSAKLTLLERIREKEKKLQAQKCFGSDPETARLEAILSQMERFTQSVMFTFSSAKKTSLFLTDLTSKLVQSTTTPLSSVEVLERLKLLEKSAPDWIKIVDDNFGTTTPKHVKILDKTRSLTSILDGLKTMKRN